MSESPIANLPAEKQIAFIREALQLIDGFAMYRHGDLKESISWRADDDYSPVAFFVNCNDLFYWACADCEDLTPDNLPDLYKAMADVVEAQGIKKPSREDMSDHDRWYQSGDLGALLFCARQRKMRPQRPYYESIPKELHPLFDACGPERDRKDEG